MNVEAEIIAGVPVHPYAGIYPMMLENELQALADDIREHGLQQPLLRLPNGPLLDGRNRLRACEIAGVSPRFEDYDGPTDSAALIDLMKSLNLQRRHLNESQRAMVAARALALLYEPAARERQRDAPRRRAKGLPPPADGGRASDKAAAGMNVSARLVRMAKVVQRHGAPSVVDAVGRGALSVSSAAELCRLPHEQQIGLLGKARHARSVRTLVSDALSSRVMTPCRPVPVPAAPSPSPSEPGRVTVELSLEPNRAAHELECVLGAEFIDDLVVALDALRAKRGLR